MDSQSLRAQTPPLAGEWAVSKGSKSESIINGSSSLVQSQGLTQFKVPHSNHLVVQIFSHLKCPHLCPHLNNHPLSNHHKLHHFPQHKNHPFPPPSHHLFNPLVYKLPRLLRLSQEWEALKT